MLFHTWTFLLFFLAAFGGYLLLRRTPFWTFWLLSASYVFYGWWNPYYLALIAFSTALDFLAVA
ncbi:MAG: MBOAT family protein, partial [Akkermansiaceae bacterium]|nr:MBOAT family protein [Akkermansiaceae bacterium]